VARLAGPPDRPWPRAADPASVREPWA
jgi:hypothetical protein